MLKCVNGEHVEMTAEEIADHLATQSEMQAMRPNAVKAEAQRRIVALTGASDMQSCIVKQLNATMRANELNDFRHDRALTAEEQAEAHALRGLALAIKHIRSRSDAIEAMQPIPSDYTADSYWA